MTGSSFGGTLWQDVKYGARLLRLNPGFAATAILSLALGIAANTSIFTLVDQILLRLLPVENPRQLVQFRMEGGRFGSQNGDGQHTFSYPLYVAFRDRNTVFSGLTGLFPDRLSMVSDDRSEMVGADWVAAISSRYSESARMPGEYSRKQTIRRMAAPLSSFNTISGETVSAGGRMSSAPPYG